MRGNETFPLKNYLLCPNLGRNLLGMKFHVDIFFENFLASYYYEETIIGSVEQAGAGSQRVPLEFLLPDIIHIIGLITKMF